MDKSKYKDYLKNVPNRDFLDYSVVYCYKDEKVLITVTNDLADSLGVTEKQLYEDSVKNIVPKGPVNLFRMLSTKSAEGKNSSSGDEEDGLLPVYLLSNDVMFGGASVLLLQDFLEKVSEKLMEKYHINLAASSLHRLLHAMKLKSIEKPKRKTLDRLSILAGFQNWEELQRAFWGE